MSEKYKILFQQSKNLYLEGSPVLIKAGALVLDNDTARVHIQLKFQNLCEKKIVALKTKIILMDTIGRKIGDAEKLYLDINAKQGEEFGSNIPIPIADSSSRQFQSSVSEICFTDGTVWNNEDLNWEPLPTFQPLNVKFTTSEARDEFNSLYCKKAQYLPLRYKDVWGCSCGNINKNPQEKCFYCDAKLSDMESADNDTLTKNNIYQNATTLVSKNTSSEIKKGIALFERIVDWNDSKQKLEKANAKIIEVKQREQKALEEKEKQNKKRKRNIIISTIGVLALIIVIIIINSVAKANKYEKAVALYEDYQYEEAMYLFDDLKGYKDADLYYDKANCLYKGKYEDAVKNYGIKEIHISDDKHSIPKEAFKNCTSLEKIIIHNKVTDIGANAFENCSAKIIWEENSSITVIGEKAFYGYKGTSITIPNSVTEIGDSAFYNCSSITSITIPNSVTEIGDSAFWYCDSLTSVVIGDSVTSIGSHAFSSCDSLMNITIPDSVTSIGDSAFWYCSSLSSVVIPDSVTSIGDSAFEYCSSLTSVEIGDSVTSIGNSAFYNCSSLTSIEIPNSVTSIGSNAFSGCSGLTNITISNSVTSIGNYAFYNCSGLTSITIPNSVTSIGDSAFFGCRGLTSITIPNSVTSIGDSAFSGCSSLRSMTIPFVGKNKKATSASGFTLFGYIFGTSSYAGGLETKQYYTSSYSYTYYIPSSLKTVTITGGNILRGAFYNCDNLTSVVIGDSVTSIGDYAFYDCDNLTSVKIGDSVTSIGDYAFYDCSSLTSVVIPDSVTSIGYEAFSGCDSLTSITFEDTTTWYTTINSTNWENKTGGTAITVTNASKNATYFRTTYDNYYWYKL